MDAYHSYITPYYSGVSGDKEPPPVGLVEHLFLYQYKNVQGINNNIRNKLEEQGLAIQSLQIQVC